MHHSGKFFPGLVATKKQKIGKEYVRIGKAQNKKIKTNKQINKIYLWSWQKEKKYPMCADLYKYTS